MREGFEFPCWFAGRGRVPAGAVSDHVWAFWDFLPTAAELAGARPPEETDGLSILPVLLGGEAVEHEYLYWEFYERGGAQAVRMGDWKAVRKWREGLPTELYHLGEDPGETHDLAAEYPEVVAKMEAIMESARFDNENYKKPD
ncbi:MAG: hypothetical protein KatS3mg115_1545 [Candidatus Poribacteria bacterium]|nr:MAG: hypothetical protein KatS3mg115_1545 [Candidatus Poribacteria bacterium]